MSNHCRQIWPQVVYTSSKTANNTHSFSLPILCRLCSSEEAQSDNKTHQKNVRIRFSVALQQCRISVSPILLNCCLLINIFYALFYLSLATRGHPQTSGWQQAWVRSHIVSFYTNVTWRHIIYSSNCWHPNQDLNGDTLKLFLCAWATLIHKQREGGSQREENSMFFYRCTRTVEHIQVGDCCCFAQKPQRCYEMWACPAADMPPTPDVKCLNAVPTANTSLVTNSAAQIAWRACILMWVSVWVCVWVSFIVLFYVPWVGADNKWMW